MVSQLGGEPAGSTQTSPLEFVPFIVNMSSGWIAKLGDTGSTAMRPPAKPMRFDATPPVSVARVAPPMMPKRGVDCGFDCERDGVQAMAARAAFRNKSRGRMDAFGLVVGREPVLCL